MQSLIIRAQGQDDFCQYSNQTVTQYAPNVQKVTLNYDANIIKPNNLDFSYQRIDTDTVTYYGAIPTYGQFTYSVGSLLVFYFITNTISYRCRYVGCPSGGCSHSSLIKVRYLVLYLQMV